MGGRLGFFQQPATANAVHRIAGKATDLTLFVGLGASLASGLPSWGDLAADVVRELAVSSPGATRDDVVDALVQSEDLLAAMEVARASWPEQQFQAAMVKSLYGRPPSIPERAISHEAIAQLAVSWFLANPESNVTILTTNYDLLIERALHRLTPSSIASEEHFGTSCVLEAGALGGLRIAWEFSLGCPVGGLVATPAGNASWLKEPSETPTPKVRVIHLHGVLTPDEVEGHLIAATSDYYREEASHKVARRLLENALLNTTCLILGTSLSDPLVLGHLHNSASQRTLQAIAHRTMEASGDGVDLPYEAHWRVPREPLAAVVFSRESFPWAVRPDLDENAKRRLEQEYAQVWRRLRLAVIWSDFYSQPYQFLREVAFTRRALAASGYFAKKWLKEERPPEAKVEKYRRRVSKTSYGKRIDRWAELYVKGLSIPKRHVASSPPPALSEDRVLWQQREIRSFLLVYRDRAIEHLMNVQDPVATAEEWKVDLWVRSPERHSLLRVASTQYDFLCGPSDSVPYPLSWQSQLPAVRAFVNGETSVEEGVGRWRYHCAIPVRQTPEVPSLKLREAAESRRVWGDFPVGALVLSTSQGPESTVLLSRPVAKRREAATLLQVAGNEIVSFSASDLVSLG